MPAIFTPNDTEKRNRRSIDDGGSGRRPPVDRKHTGGGGDGDNQDDQHSSGSRGPREMLTRYRMGVLFALAGDLMFFIGLVCLFFVRQTTGHFDAQNHYVTDWAPIIIPRVLYLNTALLIVSSITMEIARRHMFREMDVMEEWLGLGKPTVRQAFPWLAATAALGVAFIVGQLQAWQQLTQQHVFVRSQANGHFFFIITGIHGAHLLFGIVILAATLVGLFLLRSVQSRQILVDCTAWYWHSMGVFWIFLFAVLRFFQ